MNAIARLLCGEAEAAGTAGLALGQLSASVEKFAHRSVGLLESSDVDDRLTLGPFCARVLLENGCAALVGRFDVFRLVYLSEFQSQGAYDPAKRAKTSFSWTGDVMPDDKAASTLWSIDNDFSKISRALFSKHVDHVFWRPAVNNMLDFASSKSGGEVVSDLLGTDPDNYIDRSRGTALQLYSTLSKGVHWEFFASAFVFDDATVCSAIRETCVLVSKLALVSHFVPTAYASLSHEEAFDLYLEFRENIP